MEPERSSRAGVHGAGPAAQVLATAARAVTAISSAGESADRALTGAMAAAPIPAAPATAFDTALGPAVRAVTFGTLRWYLRLAALVAALLAGRAVAPALRALLAVALHQLEYSRNPPAATVSSAVDAARLLRQPRAAGLINALLRRYLRERTALLGALRADPVATSAHPAWLLAALRAAWPAECAHIIEANNAPPPMTLRVDLSRSTLVDYARRLAAEGLGAEPIEGFPAALVLAEPLPVARLPGFEEGLVSVQDAGAQLASLLLAPQRGERVLDACAAPGGKTGALLESVDGALEVTALDIDATRLARVAENLRRLRREARLVAADLADEPTEPVAAAVPAVPAAPGWWDGRRFDRILLDAPCSAVGVIRRHPDIKLLRRAEDIEALALTQRRLLAHCLRLLKPGGRLLYSTCSILPAENLQVIEAVLATQHVARLQHPEAWCERLPAVLRRDQAAVRIDRGGVQLLPGNAARTDGFYYACLTVA